MKLRVKATVGDRVVLPCVSQNRHSKEVDWRFRKSVTAPEKFVWNRKWLVNGYKSCCTIETVAAGTYNLVIYQVQINDAGFYDCIERGGLGNRHRIRLDVLPRSTTSLTTPQTGTLFSSLVNTLNCSNIIAIHTASTVVFADISNQARMLP